MKINFLGYGLNSSTDLWTHKAKHATNWVKDQGTRNAKLLETERVVPLWPLKKLNAFPEKPLIFIFWTWNKEKNLTLCSLSPSIALTLKLNEGCVSITETAGHRIWSYVVRNDTSLLINKNQVEPHTNSVLLNCLYR